MSLLHQLHQRESLYLKWTKYPTYWSSTLTEPQPHTWLVCGVGEMNWESRQWAKPLWGRGGGTQLFLKTFCVFFFYLNYCRYTYIIFHNRECDFFFFFNWGDTLGWGDMSLLPPGIYAHAWLGFTGLPNCRACTNIHIAVIRCVLNCCFQQLIQTLLSSFRFGCVCSEALFSFSWMHPVELNYSLALQRHTSQTALLQSLYTRSYEIKRQINRAGRLIETEIQNL